MKRFVLMILSCTIMLCGCTKVKTQAEIESKNTSNTSMFVCVETTINYKVFYHKETKVMYVMSLGSHNLGTFTVLVNDDGSPMLWDGEK